MTEYTLAPLPSCGEHFSLPTHLVPLAMAFAPPGTAESFDVDCELRCTLQAHITGDHYAFVMELPKDPGSVWTQWNRHREPLGLAHLADCPTRKTTGDACCGFAGHPGAHSYDLADPWQ
jgi:hypothetical protein